MGKPAILKVDIISDFVDKGISDAETGLGKLNKAALGASTAIVGGLVAAGASFAKMAIEDAAGAERMALSLRNTAGATDAQVAATEEWITAQGKALGVADDQLRPAMESLALATGDVAKAQDLAALAMDVAAASGTDVETSADAIAKAYAGQGTALGKLLPGMDRGVLKAGDFAAIQTELATITGGAAASAAGTAAGQYQTLQLALSEAAESIGAALLPIIQSLMPYLQKMADWVGQNTKLITKIAVAIGIAATAYLAINAAIKVYNTVMALSKVGTIAYNVVMGAFRVALIVATAAQWLLNAALTANPIGLVIAAIALLIGAFVLAYNKCEPFQKIIDAIWKVIKTYVITYFDLLTAAIGKVVDMIKTAWDWIKKLIDKFTSFSPPSWLPGGNSAMAVTFTAAGTTASAGTHSGAAPAIHVTVNGALDPESVARQIRRILSDHNARNGLVGGMQW